MNTHTEEQDSPSERQGIQVISRMAAILHALENRPDGLSLGELSKAASLPRSTVQRIVDALDAEGFVIAASNSRGVRLGPTLLALASSTRFHIAEVARDTLEALAKECDETVDLSIVDQTKMVFIDQIAGKHRLSALSAIGHAFPLHSCANGKAVLASMDTQELERIKKKIRLTSVTEHTPASWGQLEAQLATIRQTKIAYDHEENSLGISAMAMALRSPGGELAAISIPAPTQRFKEKEKELASILLRHVGRLQEKLNPHT